VEKTFKLKLWYAKSLTAVGKLFLITALTISTAQAVTVYDGSGQPKGFVGLFADMFNPLSSEDRRMHTQAILVALNQTQNGEIVEWVGPVSGAGGQVRVVYTYNVGDGFCRVFQSHVVNNGDVSQYQQTACVHYNDQGWTFLR
jgi:surface antigen